MSMADETLKARADMMALKLLVMDVAARFYADHDVSPEHIRAVARDHVAVVASETDAAGGEADPERVEFIVQTYAEAIADTFGGVAEAVENLKTRKEAGRS
jgi:hypothetical protein